MLDGLAQSAEDTAQEIAERWVIAFDAAVARGDETAIGETCSARPGCAFSQARIYSRYIALQIDAIEEWAAGEAH